MELHGRTGEVRMVIPVISGVSHSALRSICHSARPQSQITITISVDHPFTPQQGISSTPWTRSRTSGELVAFLVNMIRDVAGLRTPEFVTHFNRSLRLLSHVAVFPRFSVCGCGCGGM